MKNTIEKCFKKQEVCLKVKNVYLHTPEIPIKHFEPVENEQHQKHKALDRLKEIVQNKKHEERRNDDASNTNPNNIRLSDIKQNED